jgi:hypothetical protein
MTLPITHRPLKRPGRKPTTPPANAVDSVRQLAADGWSVIGIANRMGVDPKTFNRWLEDDPALSDAMALGREEEHHVLFNVLYREATEKGNVTAALGILNARHGWRQDQRDQGNRVQVNIALPGAMTLEAFQAIGKGTTNDQ